MTFLETEIKERNLAEAPRIILTTQDCWSVPLKYVPDIFVNGRSLYGKKV